MGTIERFDIEKVANIYQNCLKDDDDVLLKEYLEGYEEINNFVSSDVRAKIDILNDFCQREEMTQNFETIKTMIEYEKNAELLKNSSYVSGSRTLLRLHRGLEFIYVFLERLSQLCETDKTHNSCKEAYTETLAKHHSWVIRKGALVAMYALPTQGELLKRVCVNVPRALEILPEMLRNTKCVYNRTEELYTLHDLHGLP